VGGVPSPRGIAQRGEGTPPTEIIESGKRFRQSSYKNLARSLVEIPHSRH